MSGWAPPADGAIKWHYVSSDGKSLCGRFLWLGNNEHLEQGNEGSSSNCAACKKKLKDIQPIKSVKGG